MYKRFFLLAASSYTLLANSEIVLNADRFDYKQDVAYAYGDISLRYQDNIFFAKEAVYDKKREIITLKGDVQVIGATGFKVIADKVVFEAKNKHITFKNFYGINPDDIWLYAKTTTKEGNITKVKNSVLSSCAVDKPDWRVKFKEATYDSATKYIKLKDVKFYAGSMPLIYTPYLGFSLNRERHSGFLMPVFSYSPDEGFIYEQPYFWAISKSQDLELRPQIRTSRGYGIYNTYRFVDTAYSRGKLRFGYFHDYDSYYKKFSLKNQDHFGFEFLYENSNPLRDKKPKNYEDKLYINLNLFNDIDYLNLQNRGLLTHLEETSRFKESRINYFLYSDRDYYGITAKYYIDTTKTDNSQTIQQLPSLNYHKFTSILFDNDSLSYSVDAELTNLFREKDPKAIRGTFSLPINFHTPLFGNYLNLTVEEEFSASDTHFSSGNLLTSADENHYAAAVLHHKIELSSDLIKAYSSGIHTMILSTAFTKSTKIAEGDLKFKDIDPQIVSDFDLDMVYDSKITFGMHHFWEPAKSDGINIDYQIFADYFPEDDSKWNQIKQELTLKYKNFTFKSRFDYSIRYDHLTQFSNSLSYKGEQLSLSISHTKKEDEITQVVTEDDLTLKGSYKYSDSVTLYGGYSYDFKESMSKKWSAGFYYDRDCWNFKLIFEQDITPVLTNNDKGSIRNNSIIFQINFVPFGGVGLNSKDVGN